MSSLSSRIFTTNNTAVITGGSSGIGRAAGIMCSSRGMNVWLCDVDESELKIAVEMVKSRAIDKQSQKIEGLIVDVSDANDMKGFASKVFSDPSTHSVHFLMNNAGIGLGGKALSTSMDEFQKVMGINTYGPIHGCQAFVPIMKEKGLEGIIVNTGSKQGITMPPVNLSYNVSKAALKTWSEGLEHELMKERMEGKGKLWSAFLVPGWTNTSILLKEQRERAKIEGSTFDEKSCFFHEDKPAHGAWMPSQVIDFMLQEIDNKRFYIICPDNDVDRETDNLRMTWTMQDITEDRPPLSRWHPEWKDKFTTFLEENKKN